MSMLSRVQHEPTIKPPRIVVHGKGGVGKTTFGADARKPLFLPCEEGLGTLKVPALPRPNTYGDVAEALEELLKTKHDFGSLVVDTIDHFEPLVWAEVCRKHTDSKKKYSNIEDFGYGKGYLYADPLWTDFFHGLDALRRERDMTIIILCHNETKTVDDPMIGPYDRITPKLHKRANALLHEWADVVGYLDIERMITEKEGSKGRKMDTIMTTGRRMLYLEDRGGFVAKNRFGLPVQIEIPEKEPFNALRRELVKRLQAAKEA
jgi:hypothetical protein